MRPIEQTAAASQDAKLDGALDDSFPASDPLSFTPQRAGQMDKKASIADVDHPSGIRGLVNRVKDSPKH